MSKTYHWQTKYTVVNECLGEGGNGTVFGVRKNGTDEMYALKQLISKGAEKTSRFVTEIKTVNQYSSKVKGIIPIFDFSEEECWYVMPIAKECIKHIHEENEKITDIISGVIQLCDTLGYLHEQGISHRDIKPSNIYFYNDRYCFSDFGLVKNPEIGDSFTRSDKGLGAIFTIAPEMKRDPKHADGKKADVFSLAKTMWMFLSDDEKGFDGVYNPADSSHSLSKMKKYQNIHLLELELLLEKSTNNDPKLRPTIIEFKQGLQQWLEIYSDFDASQFSDWNNISKQIFGEIAAESSHWSNPQKIVDILNIVGGSSAYNHMLFSSQGGLDFDRAKMSAENGCIEIYADGYCHICKPKRLIFEGFDNNSQWNYFLLELEKLPPIISDNEFQCEMLVEDYPAHYVSAEYVQYGVYDYDSSEPLPKDYRVIYRYTEGKFLVVMKNGPYNHITGTYDGRHGKFSADDFREYVENLIRKYNEIYTAAKNDPKLCKLTDTELEDRILRLDEFNRDPFDSSNMFKRDRANRSGRLMDSRKYINEIYQNVCFDNEIAEFDSTPLVGLKYYLTFSSDDILFRFDEEIEYLCADGFIRSRNSSDLSDCLFLYNRKDIISLRNKCQQKINNLCKQNGFDAMRDYESCFSIKIQKNNSPEHLFTKDEIETLMRNADDRYHNQLVVDEFGYAKIIQPTEEKFLYPVRLEPWDAGNCYVGKYSELNTLDDNYLCALQGWLFYLQSGKTIYMDYVHDNRNIDLILNEISKYYH